MSAEKLAELEGLVAKATPGTWFVKDGEICSRLRAPLGDKEANDALIVWLVNNAPAMLRRLARMEEALKAMRETFQRACDALETPEGK